MFKLSIVALGIPALVAEIVMALKLKKWMAV